MNVPNDIEVIDCHCHVYPVKIAERATQAVGQFYDIEMDVERGTTDRLLEVCADTPINRFVIHSVATRPDQVSSINDFIASECAAHPECTGFMTLHQDLEDPETEIARAQAAGLRGIKLHPDTQRVNLDDPRLYNIYEIAQSRGLPMILHCGDYRYDFSHPRRMKRVLQDFPSLVVDAAHFGGWSIFDLALEFLENENCYMDMSSSLALIGTRRAEELTRLNGVERLMFGSDFPMWSPVAELEAYTAGNFTDAELQLLLHDNAERFLANELPNAN